MAASEPGPLRDGPDGPEAAQARLIAELSGSGRAASPAVVAAFRAVPRHLFLPEMPPAAAYQDEAFVIKQDADGLPVSSSSQPAIMAIMLEQLGLEPGHRVLEIGTGSGFNAALIAHIVGDPAAVVSIDIDAEVACQAHRNLITAGYGGVQVSCGDGGFGVPAHAPYDRIIVTAGAWSLAPAWLDQLAPGGRIVLPLSVRGIQLSVAFDHVAGHWAGVSAHRCGFIRMAGALAGPEAFVPVGPQPGWHVQADDGRDFDARGLYQALTGPPTDVPAALTVSGLVVLADADLWLTLTQPRLIRLTLLDTRTGQRRRPPLMPLGALAAAGPDTAPDVLAAAALIPAAAPAAASGAESERSGRPIGGNHDISQNGPPGVAVRGYGPGGPALAERLAERAQAWHDLGRPGTADLSLQAFPRGAEMIVSAGQVILDRGPLRLAVGWPVH
jgi:protein-L-isoaspartate(D-aspartate) O-methyltransferase